MTHKILKDFSLVERLYFAKFYLHNSKSIMMVEYLPNNTIDLIKGQLVIDTVYPYIVSGATLGMTDATAKNINITTETRKLYGNNESMNATLAHAVIVKDLHIRMLANLFIRFDNPSVTTKVFNNHVKAVNYLESILVNEESKLEVN